MNLDSIQSGGQLRSPRVVVYGPPGVGKTTFAAGAQHPVFILTEDGLAHQQAAHFPLARSYTEVLDAVETLHREQHSYQTVVLDSLDALEPLLWEYTAHKHSKKQIEDFGYGKGYVYAAEELRHLLKGLQVLRDQKDMTVVLVGHSDIKRFESPITDAYDRFTLRLHPRAAAAVLDWSDAVLFATYKVHVTRTDAGFGRQQARGIGHGERVLHAEERPGFLAKNRYDLPADLPLSWDEFRAAVFSQPEPQES